MKTEDSGSATATASLPVSTPMDKAPGDVTEDEDHVESHRKASPANESTRKPQAPSTSSVYSGNKIKHLKKEDGIPLWRKDIQYEFLRHVFENQKPVFSNSYDQKTGYTFADVYIYAMAVSSKTSKILRDKLLSDRRAATHMAMVCLLVNVGRMNTTLNFFPEMRAQLRTYHSIPCLQAKQDPNAYKQLQDAPRLKSILKGASEDKKEPTTIEAVMAQKKFRTNPVNLIFVLSQQAVKVTEAHFTAPREFFDLILRTTLSSKSRANAFLWLMWWYLESDFTKEDSMRNPFGPGLPSDDGLSQKVPLFEYLDEAQAHHENIDTEEEIAYGELKRLERIKIMEADAAALASTPKQRKKGLSDRNSPDLDKKKKGLEPYSDTDQTRSASPPNASTPRSGRVGSSDVPVRTGRGRWIRDPATRAANTQRLILKTRMAHVPDGSSPAPPGSSHPVLHTENTGRRARPLTAHQQAVERNRAHRVDYILDRRMRKIYNRNERKRRREGAVWRAWMRHDSMTDPFVDSDDEGLGSGPVRGQAFGGLLPVESERDDYGEEIGAFAAALRRSGRRLSRWDQLDAMGKGFGVMATTKTVLATKKGREVFEEEGDGDEDLFAQDDGDEGTADEMEVD